MEGVLIDQQKHKLRLIEIYIQTPWPLEIYLFGKPFL